MHQESTHLWNARSWWFGDPHLPHRCATGTFARARAHVHTLVFHFSMSAVPILHGPPSIDDKFHAGMIASIAGERTLQIFLRCQPNCILSCRKFAHVGHDPRRRSKRGIDSRNASGTSCKDIGRRTWKERIRKDPKEDATRWKRALKQSKACHRCVWNALEERSRQHSLTCFSREQALLYAYFKQVWQDDRKGERDVRSACKWP